MISYPERTTIKELAKEFTGRGEVRGFLFRQIEETNQACIYYVSPNNTTGWYEVFRKRINKRFSTYAYPNSKAFGVTAWTCKTEERAREIFQSLNQ